MPLYPLPSQYPSTFLSSFFGLFARFVILMTLRPLLQELINRQHFCFGAAILFFWIIVPLFFVIHAHHLYICISHMSCAYLNKFNLSSSLLYLTFLDIATIVAFLTPFFSLSAFDLGKGTDSHRSYVSRTSLLRIQLTTEFVSLLSTRTIPSRNPTSAVRLLISMIPLKNC